MSAMDRARPLFLIAMFSVGLAGCRTNFGDTISGWSLRKSLPANFKEYGYRIVSRTDGHPVRVGENAMRFKVRAGDCSWSSGWSDCANDRERHELISNDSWSRGEEWYHWSIYFPGDWPVIFPVKVALGQFHQKGSHPVWMFENEPDGYYIANKTIGSDLENIRLLTDGQMRGRWNDILIHARWTSERDGFFRVYVNGESKPQHSWTGPTKKAGRQVFFKFGIYRSFMSRRPGDEPTQVVYFDEVNRTSTCKDATDFFDCPKIEARSSR